MQNLHVSLEDQQNINRFGNLNTKVETKKVDLESLQKKKTEYEVAVEDIEEAELEGDTEEIIAYKVGTSFVEFDFEDGKKQLEADLEVIKKEINKIEEFISETQDEMTKLQAILYGKFGKENIGLEFNR